MKKKKKNKKNKRQKYRKKTIFGQYHRGIVAILFVKKKRNFLVYTFFEPIGRKGPNLTQGLKKATSLPITFDVLKQHPHKITRETILVLTLLLSGPHMSVVHVARPLKKEGGFGG